MYIFILCTLHTINTIYAFKTRYFIGSTADKDCISALQPIEPVFGAPCRTRTYDILYVRQILLPTELKEH